MKLQILALTAILAWGVAASGCATKKHVQAEVDRRVSTVENRVETVESRVGEVEEASRRNAGELRRVEEEAKRGISDARTRADSAARAAETAQGKTDQLTQEVNKNVARLDSRIADVDKYVLSKQTKIYFRTGKSTLTQDAITEIDALAGAIVDREGYRIEIQGFTDSTGSTAFNQQLSQNRAEAVLRYLVEHHHIPAFRAGIIGLGENLPAADNSTSRGRAENRRVEVRLYANPTVRGSEADQGGRPTRVSKG